MTAKTIEEVLQHASEIIQDNLEARMGGKYFGNEVNPPLEDALKDIETLVNGAVGHDDRHNNGAMMANDPSTCMDCTNPDERFARNKLRSEIRTNFNKVLRSK